MRIFEPTPARLEMSDYEPARQKWDRSRFWLAGSFAAKALSAYTIAVDGILFYAAANAGMNVAQANALAGIGALAAVCAGGALGADLYGEALRRQALEYRPPVM